MDYAALIAKELNLQVWQVANTLALLAEGATIPFIARYRKERTGEMDETVLREVDHRFTYLKELDERRAAILKSIEEQGKLTPELKAKIESCAQKNELEDIYLPYKPKRRTRAIIAREAGLEPLARLFQEKQSEGSLTPEELAKEYISEEKGVPDEATAVRMACDILAEELSEIPEIRQWLRGQAEKDGVMRCEARKEWVGKRTKFEMYYDFKEKVETLPSHRILAIRRGEKEDVLRSSIEVDVETAVGYVTTKIVTHPATMIGMVLSATARDSYERLLAPSIETDVRLLLKEHAEGEAYKVFGKNLGDLMMYPPAGAKAVIGVDPGFRTGQKLAVVDDTGKFLEHATVHALEPANQFEEATLVFLALCKRHKPILVAVGNGTGGREMESFLRKVIKNIPEEEGRPPHRDGLRSRSLRVFRIALGREGIPGTGRDHPWRHLHRASLAGPAGRAREDRPQVDRRWPVPARRQPERTEEEPGRSRRILREPGRREPEPGFRGSSFLRVWHHQEHGQGNRPVP
jgi:uncharacterized protein